MQLQWQVTIGGLREAYALRNLDTGSLQEFAAKLTGHSGPADVGNAARKLLDYNIRQLLGRVQAAAVDRNDNIAYMLDRLNAYVPPAQQETVLAC